jgi:hypothetical protein
MALLMLDDQLKHSRRSLATARAGGGEEGFDACGPEDAKSHQRLPGGGGPRPPLYLHVGPSGDVWTGDSIFAAKHLQPDYVRSVSLEGEAEAMIDNEGSRLVEILESRLDWTEEIYDKGSLPTELRRLFWDPSREK